MAGSLPMKKWLPMLVVSSVILFCIDLSKMFIIFFSHTLDQTIFAMTVAMMCIAFYRFWRWNVEKQYASDLDLNGMFPPLLKGILLCVMIFLLYMVLGCIIGDYKIEATGNWSPTCIPSFLICFVVGVAEEAMMRGFLFRYLETSFNFWTALIVSSIIFGLAHYPTTWGHIIIIIFGIGALYAVLYKYSGTLWLPIGVHSTWNYMFFLTGRYDLAFFDKYEPPFICTIDFEGIPSNLWLYFNFTIIPLISILPFTIWYLRKINQKMRQ